MYNRQLHALSRFRASQVSYIVLVASSRTRLSLCGGAVVVGTYSHSLWRLSRALSRSRSCTHRFYGVSNDSLECAERVCESAGDSFAPGCINLHLVRRNIQPTNQYLVYLVYLSLSISLSTSWYPSQRHHSILVCDSGFSQDIILSERSLSSLHPSITPITHARTHIDITS